MNAPVKLKVVPHPESALHATETINDTADRSELAASPIPTTESVAAVALTGSATV